jgi:predicted nucleic acid-binding protein
MIILDTNVLSELMRPAPDPAILNWFRLRSMLELATTTINIAEIKYGLARIPAGRRRRELERDFAGYMQRTIGARIFDFDRPAADAYGEIRSERDKAGRRLEGADGFIAAIARSRGAAIATRNAADFDGCGLTVINPWEATVAL